VARERASNSLIARLAGDSGLATATDLKRIVVRWHEPRADVDGGAAYCSNNFRESPELLADVAQSSFRDLQKNVDASTDREAGTLTNTEIDRARADRNSRPAAVFRE
jgi:hypothetical protein